MTIEEIIHDMQVIVDYFAESSGAEPVCMVEAIKILEEIKKERRCNYEIK